MSRFGPLRLGTRFTLIIVGCVCLVVAVIASYLIVRHRSELNQASVETSRMMRDDLGKRGLALAHNVALASERALVVSDFLFLDEIVRTTAKNDPDIIYGALMNGEGQVLVHTDDRQVGQTLTGEVDRLAATREEPTLSDRTYEGEEILEVVAPIKVAGKSWGVVRFGLSLASLNAEIARREAEIQSQIAAGVVTSVGVTLLLMLLGIGVGIGASRTVVRPLATLMKGVNRIREGHLDHTVTTTGSPELVELATGFNEMTRVVRNREMSLASALTEAREANRLKSEFLANISHELRTPLNAIVNIPSALLEDFETILLWHCPSCNGSFEPDPDGVYDDEVIREDCPNCATPMTLDHQVFFNGDPAEHKNLNQRAIQSGEYLLRVVNDLLDISKLQSGKMKLFIEEIDLAKVLEELHATVDTLAELKEITLTFPVIDESVRIRADAVKLTQVLVNLIGNAIKFTERGGEVELAFDPAPEGHPGFFAFCVRDNGVGIPEEELPKIFDAFRQVDGSHTRAHGGTGLGLTITRQLVELQGGVVWVESTPGQGSTFSFTVPAHGEAVEPAPAARTTTLSKSWGAGMAAVVVDDDDTYLAVVRRMLKSVGVKAELLTGSENAAQRIAEKRPSFVLLDVMLPKESGINILRQLKGSEETRDIPVLVSTAFHANQEVVRGLGGLWLPKPWRTEDLLACLREENIVDAAVVSAAAEAEQHHGA